MDPSVPKYKVVILGEANSGKTSILLKYVTGQFSKVRKSSIQADFMEKRISVGNPPTPICMYIWDTAGGEQYHALGPIYYRDAHAAVIVYDITDGTSFEKVQRWVKELKKIVGEDIVIAVAGNKSDLHNARVVKKEDAIEYV
jgi:Ras-related protein Rab-21